MILDIQTAIKVTLLWDLLGEENSLIAGLGTLY